MNQIQGTFMPGVQKHEPDFEPPILVEDEAGPGVVLFLGFEGEAEGGGTLHEQRDVVGVEAAEDETGAGGHLLTEQGHIVEENIAVDIRQNQVEKSFHLII